MVYSTPALIDDQFQLDEASQSSLGQACSLAFFTNFDKKQGNFFLLAFQWGPRDLGGQRSHL
jgi:hypothetical protein